MPADAPGKPRASPLAGAPASARRSARPPRSAAEHRKGGPAARGGRGGAGAAGLRRPRPGPQSSKPVMEKRRRARINESLGQLKTLLLDALRKDSSRHSKLEKADILEMTVRHLQSLRRVQVAAALAADPAVLGQYRAGFRECLAEAERFLAGCEAVPADVRARLLGHLAACLGQLQPSRRPAPAPEPPGPRRRPGTVFARPLPPGPSRAPAAVRGAGPQGQGAPWRPWLR